MDANLLSVIKTVLSHYSFLSRAPYLAELDHADQRALLEASLDCESMEKALSHPLYFKSLLIQEKKSLELLLNEIYDERACARSIAQGLTCLTDHVTGEPIWIRR